MVKLVLAKLRYRKTSFIAVLLFLVLLILFYSRDPLLLQKSEGNGDVFLIFYVDKTLLPLFREVETTFLPQLEREMGINIEISYVLGSSGFVLSQLNLTKKGDLYASDDFYFAKIAAEKKLIEPSDAKIIAYIVLAIFVPEKSGLNIKGLKDLVYYDKELRIAIGDPSHVSAGKLTEELLGEHGLWKELFRRHDVILAPSASDVANLVRQEAVDAGITFNVFKNNIKGIEIIDIEKEYNTRVAPVVIAPTSFSKHKDIVLEIIDYMSSKNFEDILSRYGFFNEDDIRKILPYATVPDIEYIVGKD